MTWILFVWTVVGVGRGPYGSTTIERDWRHMGEFSVEQTCKEVARQLAIPGDRFKCIRSK